MLTNPAVQAEFVPADHGMASWSFDPSGAVSSVLLPTAGTLYAVKLKLAGSSLITSIIMMTSAAGGTLTAGQNFAMLFDETGSRVGLTADLTAAWAAGPGVKDMPLTAPVQVNGPFCTVGFYANGTTLPTFRVSAGFALVGNVNLAAASSRYGAANTGLTTSPPGTLGTITANTFPWWVGLR